jgi:hypothetical protein
MTVLVIPAKAGISLGKGSAGLHETPAFAGMTVEREPAFREAFA